MEKHLTMTQEIEYKLVAEVSGATVHPSYTVTSIQVLLDDDSGFTEEQLSLILEEQLELTLQGISDIEGVEQTELAEYVP